MGISKALGMMRDKILYAKTPPKLTALSFALGVAIAMGPFPGLHVVTGLLLLKVWRLNSVVLFTGIFIHNPWTMIPIHTLALAIGDLLLYQEFATLDKFSQFPWKELGFFTFFEGEFWQAHGDLFLGLLAPFVVGSLVLALVCAIASYKLSLHYLMRKISDDQPAAIET